MSPAKLSASDERLAARVSEAIRRLALLDSLTPEQRRHVLDSLATTVPADQFELAVATARERL